MPLHYHNQIVKEQMGSQFPRELHYPSPLTAAFVRPTFGVKSPVFYQLFISCQPHSGTICDEPFILSLLSIASRGLDVLFGSDKSWIIIHRPRLVKGWTFLRQKKFLQRTFLPARDHVPPSDRCDYTSPSLSNKGDRKRNPAEPGFVKKCRENAVKSSLSWDFRPNARQPYAASRWASRSTSQRAKTASTRLSSSSSSRNNSSCRWSNSVSNLNSSTNFSIRRPIFVLLAGNGGRKNAFRNHGRLPIFVAKPIQNHRPADSDY